MKKQKGQLIKEGAVIKIDLPNNRRIFGRLLPGYQISLYDFVIKQVDKIPSVDEIIISPILMYVRVFIDVITKDSFETIGFKELTLDEINKIPPHFTQDMVNYNCKIYYEDGREQEANPEECIDLEPSLIWEAEGLIERIDDHYAGRKNFHVEYNKVILSEEDPRYKKGTDVKWDFKKGVFY